MADIAVVPAQVAPAKTTFETTTMIASTAITKGAAVIIDTAGKAALARATIAGTAGVVGIALSTVSAGQPVEVLTRGLMAGFTLASQAYGATIYLSDTASGILGDAAGTVSTKIGRVWPSTDGSLTKVLFVCPALV